MNEYRYFIANKNKIGTLVCNNKINGNDMILLIGYIIYSYGAGTVAHIVNKLTAVYDFEILKESITAAELNSSPETPYTYYDLIDENGYCEDDGYMYVDIGRIKKLFSKKKSQEMLSSIRRFNIEKEYIHDERTVFKKRKFVITRDGDKSKNVLRTSYDKTSLSYLLTNVMGGFFEEYEDESIGFTPDDLAQMLLKIYPKDFILSDDDADFIIDDLETWEQKCSSYETIKTIELFEKNATSSEQLFSMLKKHYKQNGYHSIYAEKDKEKLLLFYKPYNKQAVCAIRKKYKADNNKYIEIGFLNNKSESIYLEIRATISYNEDIRKIYGDVIQKVSLVYNEDLPVYNIMRNPGEACLDYLGDHSCYISLPI